MGQLKQRRAKMPSVPVSSAPRVLGHDGQQAPPFNVRCLTGFRLPRRELIPKPLWMWQLFGGARTKLADHFTRQASAPAGSCASAQAWITVPQLTPSLERLCAMLLPMLPPSRLHERSYDPAKARGNVHTHIESSASQWTALLVFPARAHACITELRQKALGGASRPDQSG